MSIVVGFSLMDGILLGADCRATYSDSGPRHADWVQRIIRLTDNTIIGFVGDIDTAGRLLKAATDQITSLPQDGERVNRWLPRLFRREFERCSSPRRVEFLVGSVIKGRPTVVTPSTLAEIRSCIGSDSVREGVASLLATPPGFHAVIPGQPPAMLSRLVSPNFKRCECKSLWFTPIGSGSSVENTLKTRWVNLLTAEPGDVHKEAGEMAGAMLAYFDQSGFDSVGGLVLMMKVTSTGVCLHGFVISRDDASQTNLVEMRWENGRVIQRNLQTSKEVQLYLPWELRGIGDARRTFNDFRGPSV
jgi:hypothetical protein